MDILQNYSPQWSDMYAEEARLIKRSIPAFSDIQHIGSTAVPGMTAKPIIDIGVLIESASAAEKYIRPLQLVGYRYYPESSSTERHFFRKGNPVVFHLSLAYSNRGTFWERQMLFRDYLCDNQQARIEYSNLKRILLQSDPAGGQKYINGKSEFIESVLRNNKNFSTPETLAK